MVLHQDAPIPQAGIQFAVLTASPIFPIVLSHGTEVTDVCGKQTQVLCNSSQCS